MPASAEYIQAQMNSLTREDWQYIHMSVMERFKRSDAKSNEPPNSKAYKEQKTRILNALMTKAYSGS